MEKLQLRKNRLDLEYHGQSQKANALLILITTGALGATITFIGFRESNLFYLSMIITLVVFVLGVVFYNKSSNKMERILDEIESLGKRKNSKSI